MSPRISIWPILFAENSHRSSKNRIDFDRVKYVAARAQISSYIESTSLGYDTFVGDRGIVEGGQTTNRTARAYINQQIFLFLMRTAL